MWLSQVVQVGVEISKVALVIATILLYYTPSVHQTIDDGTDRLDTWRTCISSCSRFVAVPIVASSITQMWIGLGMTCLQVMRGWPELNISAIRVQLIDDNT